MMDGDGVVERHDRFGVTKREKFLDALGEHCNVKRAADLALISKSTAYRLYRRDAGFAAQWQEALAQGYARLEERLLAHALRSLDEDGGERGQAGSAGEEGADGNAMRAAGENKGALAGRTAFTNPIFALRLLARHKATLDGGRIAPKRAHRWRSTPESADEALRKRLDLLARRLAKEAAAKGGGAESDKAKGDGA